MLEQVGVLEEPWLSFKLLRRVLPSYFGGSLFRIPQKRIHQGDAHALRAVRGVSATSLKVTTRSAAKKILANDYMLYKVALDELRKRDQQLQSCKSIK